MTPFHLLVLAVAVYRGSRLIVADIITESLRKRLAPHSLSELHSWRTIASDFVSCYWCVSIWLGALAIGCELTWQQSTLDVAYVLACSAVAGILGEQA